MKDQSNSYPLPVSSLAKLLALIFARHSRLLRCILVVVICAGVVAYLQGTNARVAPQPPMTFVVTNTMDSGPGSFRQAIIDANANPGLDSINFNIPGAGVKTIVPTAPLPAITGPVVIDGYTQPGASVNTLAIGDNAVLLIELNGANAGSFIIGLDITTASCTVRGLVINRFTHSGIVLSAGGNHIIEGNFIGTDAIGAADLGNAITGVLINFTANNRIGGSAPAQRNVISGNNNTGVRAIGPSATGNLIQGNYIGTDKNGTAALGNTFWGVDINSPANTLGGTNAGAGNIISGNGIGLEINGAAATGNVVAGNLVGINAAGTATLPNAGNGIELLNAANSNTVGGTTAAARNIISGNNLHGVSLFSGATGNTIKGNFIGTDISGTADLGNAVIGIAVDNADNNTIGGTAPGELNLIFGNNGDGVNIRAAGTLVQGNTIWLNSGDGVRVDTGARNAVLSNSIVSNGVLGIRLANGGNNNQAPPVISSVSSSGGFISVQGTATGPPNTTGTIQFFANDACDSSGSGEGQIFLGSVPAAFQGNGSALGSGATLPGTITPGQVLTATTTDANNNTSGFSTCRVVTNTSFNISGRVLDGNGNAIGGLSLSLNGAATVNTDGNGNYTFANLAAGGNYTVTPSSTNYSLSPANQTFNNLNVNRIANFVGTQTIVNITGKVTDSNNVGVNNVTIALTKNGLATGTAQTDVIGNYSFSNQTAGANYVVTPLGSFTPSSQTLSNLSVNATANFKVAPSIPSQCNTTSFVAASNFAAGSNPRSVAVGDLNGDGKLDLALANEFSDNVSILTGDGNGVFGAPTNFAVAVKPVSVSMGDFNGDGKLDLAVANSGSANLSILLGTGTATFGAATNFAVGTTPDAVAVGDLNTDGKLDLAVANFGSNNVSILLGNGTGTFGVATNFAAGTGSEHIAVADFNGDGKLDLAVSNQLSNNVSILLGNGTGGFTGPTHFAVSSNAYWVSSADFDEDSKLDLAVVNFNSSNISILKGTGTGSFIGPTNFTVGERPISVEPGDFNGDSKLDLSVVNFISNSVSILLGTGNGTFSVATNFAVGTNPRSVTLGDFNGDGKVDLATANFNSNNVSILLNNAPTCNTLTSLTISGRIADSTNNSLAAVTVTLSGPVTSVVKTDINGNYALPNLAPGGNYAVTIQSSYFVFAPSRFDFLNLSNNQTANFSAVPGAVPLPPQPLDDGFTSPDRDPTKWNLGTLTQPAGAFDPRVTTAQVNGQLVITPLNQATGLHYNGYVSVVPIDLVNGKLTVEVPKAATGRANTIFAIGANANNFFRFMVGPPTSLVTLNGIGGLDVQQTTTTQELLLQVMIAGQLTTLNVLYDPVKHRYMRFRHTLQVNPPFGAILFEVSPDDLNYTVLRRTLIRGKPIDTMTIELSAGTAGATNAEPAKFDNVKLVLSTLQFSAGNYFVGESDGSAQITVTRAGTVDDPASVNFSASDGTARTESTYIKTTGTLMFLANETSKTFRVSIVNNYLAEGGQTVNLLLSNPFGGGLNSPARAVLTIADNDSAPWEGVLLADDQAEIKTWTIGGHTYAYVKLLFPNAGYRVVSWGLLAPAGTAFSADASVEKLAGASVQELTTTAQIYDLGPLMDGDYTFTFKNSGAVVKSHSFKVNSTTPPDSNPINGAEAFVRQQYLDFLNRDADSSGLAFWTNNITKCSDPAQLPPGQTVAECTLRQRESTSGAFFLSPEFQYTGFYVYRMYQGALGRPPKLSEFKPDAQFVGAGIVVNGQLSGPKIEQNKADFAQEFVNCTDPAKYRCAEFKEIYDKLNNQEYVDKLFQTTGDNSNPSTPYRVALVNELNANPGTATRASVLQKVVDGILVISEGNQQFTTEYGHTFYDRQFNRAFVALEYFGYMKRDPDEGGYAFWLGKLNQYPSFLEAEMVLAFISSPEYRSRFGEP
jgi:hypothetical protein